MKTWKPLLAAAALTLAACGGGATATDTGESSTTTSEPAAPTTSTTTTTTRAETSAADGLLTYAYSPGTTLTYDLALDQQIRIDADGEGGDAAFPEGELPLEANFDTSIDTTIDFAVFEGPEEGTYELDITATFGDFTATGEVNGEPLEESDAGFAESFADLGAVDVTVVVDEQGKVLSVSGGGMDSAPLGGMGDLGSLADMGSSQLGRPLGPEFPDRELSVGDTWTESYTEEGPAGPITVEATHEVTGTDEIDGEEVLVIDSTVEVGAYDIDFSEFLRSMFEGFAGMAPEGDGTTDTTLPPDVAEMLEQIEFFISVAPTTSDTTTWFDADDGIVRQADQQTSTALTMDFTGPDETTGELMSFTMDMAIDQQAVFTLAGQDTTES